MRTINTINSSITVISISAAIFAILILGGYFVMADFAPRFPVAGGYMITVFFAIMFWGVFMPVCISSRKGAMSGKVDDRKLLNRFMIYKTVKILVALVFAATYVMNNKETKLPFLILFAVWYFVTLGLEVYAWSSMEKQLRIFKENNSSDRS